MSGSLTERGDSSLPPEDGDDAVIGRAFWRSLVVIGVAVLVGGVAIWRALQTPPVIVKPAEPVVLPKVRDEVAVAIPAIPFRDITTTAGIDFVHYCGAKGQKLLPETMGSGCAAFDFDNDGDQDLLFVNSCDWAWDQPDVATATTGPTLALYANDGRGGFQNVTEAAGLAVTLYGMGVACGDYDNDGWTDLFITAVGPNRLLRNDHGKFVDVTAATGTAGDDRWSSGAAWCDFNRDGRLDLFVANYVKWSREIDLQQDFRLVGVGRAYGPPMSFGGTLPYLYRNEGDGKFTEVAAEAGLHVLNPNTGVPMAKSLGVAPIDLDRDGWIDLVIANDTVQNFVFHNRKDGTFEEIGAATGVAFDVAGNARGAMGIDAGYFRNDGTLGLAIGNFSNEMTALYVAQQSPLEFTDEAVATGLGPPSRLDLKFGVNFVDFDLDGRLDLVTANGHLEEEINLVQASQHYAQPPHLFWNCGATDATEFRMVSAEKTGPDFAAPLVGRGTATADLDGDGDLDLVITANRGRPRVLKNEQTLGHAFVRCRLVDTVGPREAIGAWVELTHNGVTQRRQVMPTRGYLSQSELVVTFGLGQPSKTGEDSVEVRIVWPDGTAETRAGVPVNRLTTIERAGTVK
jgi:enediyne biosynthesis protein E4